MGGWVVWMGRGGGGGLNELLWVLGGWVGGWVGGEEMYRVLGGDSLEFLGSIGGGWVGGWVSGWVGGRTAF